MRQLVVKAAQKKQALQALEEAALRCTSSQHNTPTIQAVDADGCTQQQPSSSSPAAEPSKSKHPVPQVAKQLTAEATVSRLSMQQGQQNSANLLKQRQHQQHSAQQQSVLQQQRRSSFERRVEPPKGYTAVMQSTGASTASRRPSKQLRPAQKNVHELFTVWTTTAFYAAV